MLSSITSSIRGKLLLLIAAVTFLALFIAGTSLLVYEARTYHERWVSDLRTQAEILGSSTSAALAFDDRETARQNLALLGTRPVIIAAGVYSGNGQLFAGYVRTPNEQLPATLAGEALGSDVRGEFITLVTKINDSGSGGGFVYLRASYGLMERVLSYAGILIVVMLLSLLGALLVGSWLQRRITAPITAVADTAHRVIETRDFSLRVDRKTSDEVGYLVHAFNSMLAEIGERSEALVRADRMKDQFLATLAHELRNPLAPMRNALEILKLSGGRGELASEAHRIIERQTKQLVRLVDDLLDVSRISTGKLILRRGRVTLAEVIESAVEIARPLIEAHRHALVVNLPASTIVLSADATRLSQVFSNLLTNAAKYTDEGGRIQLDAQTSRGEVAVTVTDNGIGIADELLPRVFEMFTQASSSLERPTQSGLGVGLALARKLVELHGGTIEAFSEGPGKGSRFTVTLPVLNEPARREAPPGNQSRTGAGAHRIVVVDDNADFANTFAILLKSLGSDVQVAYDGESGLRAIEALSPDLAFVDLGLPGMSGYDLARTLRASGRNGSLVLIAVSGWGQERDKARSAAAGFDAHLVKPVDPGQIEAIIERVCNGRGSAGASASV